MKFFISIKLLFCYIYLVAAISGTKKKRKSAGLIFQRSSFTTSFCSLLGCKDGRGYTSSNDGECYSVNRCTKCKMTNLSESLIAYCSVIPTIQSELTIFQGYLKISKSGLEILNSDIFTDEDSNISENDEPKTDDSEDSQEDDYDNDESDEEVIHTDDTNFSEKKNTSKSTSNLNKELGVYSLLELVSQMAESEFEEENHNTSNLQKSNKLHSKGLFSKVFGKKKKNKPEKNQATQFKKTNRFSFNLNSLKNKFRDKNKNGSGRLNLSHKEFGESGMNIQQKLNNAQISKGTTIELEATGSALTERLSKCTVS
ncbi:uncharacterized protein ELE39_002703 [Cryptosporidium sp. chipmunk genotype I]|uniref:uncharacterized protein n=1 Tax=Cryptosporidium sp. chipmunk genotype I TaxID=1280935 RepID=UPI00351A9916|nr:hypothetical protein ELE39_002703 [Cryptosporidium sp. chipmunk genotype I]